ncbi:helix-turn-helix domain-containing protein [Actinomyces capricornis]|uniref:helix-turn-helix domain-containing protein n=1 Tax=Actinomyces capricornis TaxID=2755559 RepID=UPI001CC35033|nr:helix-turn-helix domain-containing protein [Actinomyces capricornis]
MLEGSLAEVVAGNIRLEAARVGVSQAEIAKILGLSRSAVSLRYRGRVEWGITEVELVAWYLNLPVTDLLQKRARPRRELFF